MTYPLHLLLLALSSLLWLKTANAQTKNFYGDGKGVLIRELAGQYELVYLDQQSTHRLGIDKSSKTVINAHTLGATVFGVLGISNGDYLLLDTITDPASGFHDVRLTRVQPDGTAIWSQHFGDNTGNHNFIAFDAEELSNGGFSLIAQSTKYPIEDRITSLIIVQPDGVLSTETRWQGEIKIAKSALGSNDFYVKKKSSANQSFTGDRLQRIDSEGNLLWEYLPQGPPPFFYDGNIEALAPTNDGGVLVAQRSVGANPEVRKLNALGQELWVFVMPAGFGWLNGISKVLETADGGAILNAYRGLGGGGQSVVEYHSTPIHIDATGQLLWERSIEGKCDVPGPMGTVVNVSRVTLFDLIATTSGGFAAVGTGGDGQNCDQVILVETDANGNTSSVVFPPNGGAVQGRLSPNPSAGTFTISLSAEAAGSLHVEFFDAMGKRGHLMVRALVPGENTFDFQGETMSAGIYQILARIETPGKTQAVLLPRLYFQP